MNVLSGLSDKILIPNIKGGDIAGFVAFQGMEEADLLQEDRRKLADREIDDFSSQADARRLGEPIVRLWTLSDST